MPVVAMTAQSLETNSLPTWAKADRVQAARFTATVAQGQHGPVAGQPKPAGRDILSEFGPDRRRG